MLRYTWSFTCTCPRCSSTPADRRASDERLREYRKLHRAYLGDDREAAWSLVGLERSWREIGRAIELLINEGLQSEVADCWLERFEVSIQWGSTHRAKMAGQRWLEEQTKVGGQVSPDVVESVKNFAKRIGWRAFETDEPKVRLNRLRPLEEGRRADTAPE